MVTSIYSNNLHFSLTFANLFIPFDIKYTTNIASVIKYPLYLSIKKYCYIFCILNYLLGLIILLFILLLRLFFRLN